MGTLPSGAVTFLFTDIAGSTRLFQRWGEQWADLLYRHQEVIRLAVTAHGGVEVRTEGDSFFVAFSNPVEAVLATAEAQAALAAQDWPDHGVIRIRAGLHIGYATPQAGDYVALAVHQAARVSKAAHPGQTLLSEACASSVRMALPSTLSLISLGTHRLKDFDIPLELFEVNGPGLASDFPPLETAWRGETNFPLQRTSFVGREHDTEQVRAILEHARLVTVTGPGGVGKTRLALHTATSMLTGAGDGVWLVELASLTDPRLVAAAVARAFGVPEDPDQPIVDTLVAWLRSRRLLIVLDNCEHVVEGCAELVDSILRTCPTVDFLATSRQPLEVEGEHVYRLSPLGLPPDDPTMPSDEATEFEAVQLFVERARAHQPAFTLDALTVQAVTSICRRLEGVPLAIELAAARLRSLSIDTIDARLDDQFRLLTGGHRFALPRQQTLRALVDWSYNLLDDDERALLRTLAVFSGGWTLEAAEAVAAAPDSGELEVLDLLTSLVDKSLVQAESRGSDVRYGMLEIVRQYAEQQLIERGDAAVTGVRRSHRDFYLTVAERARQEMDTGAQRLWLDRLDVEDSNLRTAMQFSFDDAEGAAPALRLLAALCRFWVMRGRAVEGMEQATAVLGRADAPTAERAAALVAVANLYNRAGDFAGASQLLDEALAVRRQLDDDVGCAEALNDLAWLATRRGDYASARAAGQEALQLADTAEAGAHLRGRIHATLGDLVEREDLLAGRVHFEQARRYFEEVGDRGASARVLNNLGLIDLSLGDHLASRRALEECLSIFSDLQDAAALPTVLSNLGLIAIEEREFERAQDLFTRGLTLGHRTLDKELMVYTLLGLAMAAGGLGDSHRGAVLHGAVDTLSTDVGMALDALEARLRQRSQEELRLAMGETEFAEAHTAGASLALDDAVAFALADGVRARV
jgi:predicted ATPase/class 3 adenylate cyclase/Tfp pilus assembly protein PilF